MRVAQAPEWAGHADLIAFYSQHRGRPDDLYPSERRFLPWLARHASSVLDTGCAAGGFSQIWRQYHPGIAYTGVDISLSLVSTARALHPEVRFLHGDVTKGLALPNRYATVVQALGWLNWEPGYVRAMRELWRLVDRYLFFDVRLAPAGDRDTIGRQHVALSGTWDGTTTTPYVVVSWPRFARHLVDLRPATILGYGYWGKPAETVMGVQGDVCFATFVMEKALDDHGCEAARVCLDLPLAWPDALVQQTTLFPAAQLNAWVPGE